MGAMKYLELGAAVREEWGVLSMRLAVYENIKVTEACVYNETVHLSFAWP